jgi:hypothetical protein
MSSRMSIFSVDVTLQGIRGGPAISSRELLSIYHHAMCMRAMPSSTLDAEVVRIVSVIMCRLSEPYKHVQAHCTKLEMLQWFNESKELYRLWMTNIGTAGSLEGALDYTLQLDSELQTHVFRPTCWQVLQ